ncbi:single-stranded DNA-binding protein [Streptomyces filamentosus]|uniref:single-stranded DNA-binding protein n=1 Tax=Streptomyces filamentosus TaxID=67294 RepID=UPI0037D1678E
MPLPTITGTARIVADPELRFTQSGKAACSVRLAFNSRRLNKQTNEWEDGDTFWVRGTAWDRLAEHVAESLAKGMEVVVAGELRTESWEKDGQKQQSPALLIRSIGPSLAFATASVTKAGASSGGQAPAGQRPAPVRPQPQDDPWATGPAASDEPPF